MEIRAERNSATFWVRVKPRSARERLTRDSAGGLQLEVHAAPTEGEANRAAVEYLARSLRLSRAAVEIVTGEKSRRKLVRVSGPSGDVLKAQIAALANAKSSRRTP